MATPQGPMIPAGFVILVKTLPRVALLAICIAGLAVVIDMINALPRP